ncbi:hypothetical protein [Kribbella sp. NPDC051620]|uniref:hypothetical protein n=1 Tax=Kribbella sp. NPDC051620 TaxID=3364120 RepID=UPI00378A3535
MTTGWVDDEAANVWGRAAGSTGVDSSRWLSSTIVCLSTPVRIAVDPGLMVGSWVEHALFPVVQVVSLELFDDVAFPDDDDDLDTVFAHARAQLAADYCQRIVVGLELLPAPDGPTLDTFLKGADVLGTPSNE